MIYNDYNLCLIHKAREEYICINSICVDKQNKLSCYKCLEDQHVDHHNPKEDFKSIYAIIEHINLEKEERLIILENAKQWNLYQKKEKRQALEKSQIFSHQYKNELQSQIDQQFDQSYKKINEIQICLEEANPYNPFCLSKLIFLYKQNIKEFTEQIDKIKFKTLGNSFLIESNSDINLTECVEKLSEKIQFLEKKVEQLSIQKSFQKGRNNFFCSVIVLSLITIFIVQSFYNPFSDFEKKIDQKISSTLLNYEEILKSQNEQINQLKKNFLEFIDQQIQDFSQGMMQISDTLKQQELKNNELGDIIFNMQLSSQENEKNIIKLTKQEIEQNNKIAQDQFQNKFEQKFQIVHQFMKKIELKIEQTDQKLMEIEKNINSIQEFIKQRKNHHKNEEQMNFVDTFDLQQIIGLNLFFQNFH